MCDLLAEDESEGSPEDASEEQRAIRPLRSPCEPSREEIDNHNLTHAQFRSWCPHCVRGRGKNSPHYPVVRDAEAIPIVTFDYCFLGSGRTAAAESDAEAQGLSPVLVAHDDLSKGVFAHAVLHKGTEYAGSNLAVRRVCADLDSLGYKRVVFRDDGEASLEAFLSAVKRAWDGEVIPEQSATGEVQSHGAVERGVQTVEGFTRTLRSALTSRLGRQIPLESAVMSWMVTHAAAIFRRCSVGVDGRTAYERNKGRPASTPIVEFGEKIW